MEPKEYISKLKQTYAMPYKSEQVVDEDFHKITLNELSKLNISEEKANLGLDLVVDDIYTEILALFDQISRSSIESCIAVGVVDIGAVNAFIAKEKGTKTIGIIFSSGLMMLLHKLFKLILATLFPGGVTYCSRGNPSKLGQKEYSAMFTEMCNNYIETQIPFGPRLKFSEELQEKHSQILFLAETFIFCHELAHFLNGDLNDPSEFTLLEKDGLTMKYIEGKDQEKEKKADVKGFELMNKYMDKAYPDMPSEVRLISVVQIMDVLAIIGFKETSKYPSPKDRVINIAQSFYGEKIAKFWKDSYSSFHIK